MQHVPNNCFLKNISYLKLWQQTSGGNTQLFVDNSWYKDIKGDKDKACNQLKAGGDGHVEEKECTGNKALAVCGGESLLQS